MKIFKIFKEKLPVFAKKAVQKVYIYYQGKLRNLHLKEYHGKMNIYYGY